MSDIATTSLVLSSFVVLVAALLAWKEWCDRRARAVELTPEDSLHYFHQDTRRSMGIAVMGLLAVGLVVGSRTPTRLGNRANPQFLVIWLGVFLLIALLLLLAMIDWLALRGFARRQRSQILRERIEIIREEQRLKKARGIDGNGQSDGPHDGVFS